ncbi:MAG: T9SS type A sorting domain-containing protein [Prolixibacteraceae bacterium]
MKIIAICFTLLFTIQLFSQDAIIDFENNRLWHGDEINWLDIEDSAENIWQIGTPQKSKFASAYSLPNVIITDTVEPYTANNNSAFVVKIPIYDPEIFYGFSFNFDHKCQTDKNKDGGYIEISYDYGTTWTNIVYDTLYCNRIEPCVGDKDCLEGYSFVYGYTIDDTIKGGIPAFSGSIPDWVNPGYEHNFNKNFICPDSLFLKFSFKSDEIQDTLDGWMIDNLATYIHLGPIGIDEKTSNEYPFIYPNPITANSVLKLNNSIVKSSRIEIISLCGEKIYSEIFNNNEFNIGKLNLKNGIYYCRILNSNTSYVLKFIVNN